MHKPVVLIVDDELLVFEAIKRDLRREQLELLYARDGVQALQILGSRPVDIVVSDHLMPKMTGIELLKSISTRFPNTVRILLTGHADVRLATEAINQGSVYKFLTKPCEPEELRVALRQAVRCRIPSRCQ